MANYLKKEISEWNTKDLCSWLIDNKYPGISELCQNNSLSGYDLFFIDDNILKNELNLSSFHERKVTMKLINKLINEHLKLNIINSNGDNVILSLDNNQETSLGELSDYIGGMFNMDPKDILYKDSTKKEVLSPTLKIVPLLILYPKIYKTLNVSNMKDYHQADEELMESGSRDYQDNNNNNEKPNMNNNKNNNNNQKNRASDIGIGSIGSNFGISDDMAFQEMESNKKYNTNNNYKLKNNNNMNYRGNNNRDNEEVNNNRNNRRDMNENNNYKYNNNNFKNNNKMNNHRNQNDNRNDNFLLSAGSGEDNFPEQINDNNMNKMNMKENNNMKYNNYNRKPNYMMENDNENEDFQNNPVNNNLGRKFKTEERMYRERESSERQKKNFQYQGGQNEMMGFNEESNLGLLSSGIDDEMKFKPSYQINNMENNNN